MKRRGRRGNEGKRVNWWHELVVEKPGNLHSARIILYSFDFEEIRQAQRQVRWDDATTILSQAGIALKQTGAR